MHGTERPASVAASVASAGGVSEAVGPSPEQLEAERQRAEEQAALLKKIVRRGGAATTPAAA